MMTLLLIVGIILTLFGFFIMYSVDSGYSLEKLFKININNSDIWSIIGIVMVWLGIFLILLKIS